MQSTCARCGRPLSVAAATPGASAQVACSCGHASVPQGALEPPPTSARDVGPLPSPGAGHFEVDPWSLPAPEDGYENLVLEDARPGADADAASAPDDADRPDPAVVPEPEA